MPITWVLFRVHQLQLSPLLPSYSMVFLVHEQVLDNYLSFCFLLILLCCLLGRQSSRLYRFSIFCWLSLGLVVLPTLEVLFVSQNSQRALCVSSSRTNSDLCIYNLFVSNLNFLHNSLWIIFPTLSCLVLYLFCANLLHSLIMGLIVSSRLPQSLLLISSILFASFSHQR